MVKVYTTVKEGFTHTFGYGSTAYQVEVPAGANTQSASAHGDSFRWVAPSIFPAGSIERHDAEHYGIRVPLSNVNQWEA